MGISANLNVFISKDEYTSLKERDESLVDFESDLGEELSLYDFISNNLHHLIAKESSEIVNNELAIKNVNIKYGLNLKPSDIFYTHYSYFILKDGRKKLFEDMQDDDFENFIKAFGEVSDLDNNLYQDIEFSFEKVEYNIIYFKTIAYLGSKGSFKENIYSLYHAKKHYPWIFFFEQINDIYNYNYLSKKDIENIILTKGLNIDKEYIYIDLGY